MKVYRCSGSKDPRTVNLSTRWRRVVSFTHGTSPQGKKAGLKDGRASQPVCMWWRANFLTLPLSPQPTLTDWASPVYNSWVTSLKWRYILQKVESLTLLYPEIYLKSTLPVLNSVHYSQNLKPRPLIFLRNITIHNLFISCNVVSKVRSSR
jgi:hypothetical protein